MRRTFRAGDQLPLASPAQMDAIRGGRAKVDPPFLDNRKPLAKPLNVLLFARLCQNKGLPRPVKEFAFHPKRKWALDLAWPDLKVALEVHGGVFTQGRHNRGDGFIEDRRKMNEAQLMGWIVIEVPRSEKHEDDWMSDETLDYCKRAIQRQRMRADHPPVKV